MKKLCIIALILCLLCPAALCVENEDVYIAESHVHAYATDSGLQVHTVFAVENRSDVNISPAAVSVMLLTAENAAFQENVSSLYPMILAPGQRGYVYGIFDLSGEKQALYDHPEVYFAFLDADKNMQQMLDETHKLIAYPAASSVIEGANVQTTFTNDTGYDIVLAPALFLYRNAAGEIVGVKNAVVSDLPVGQSIRIDHSFALAPFTAVEVICFTIPM